MNIRKAAKNDLPKILKMNEASVPHVSSIELSDMERFLKQSNSFLVVEVEGKVAGFMIVLRKGLDYPSLNYKFFCENYNDFDYVDRIVIAEGFRGQKFGSALYDYLIKNSDKQMVTCEVNLEPPNPDSLGFHKSLGFNVVAEQETEGGKKRVVMMVKKL